MQASYINPNPQIFQVSEIRRVQEVEEEEDPVDSLEVFGTYPTLNLSRICTGWPFAPSPCPRPDTLDVLRRINDPEHPLTLEQLNVVKLDNVFVNNQEHVIKVRFTPTIPHCSMATLIGLCIRVKLLRSLPDLYKVDVEITPGTHNSEDSSMSISFCSYFIPLYFTPLFISCRCLHLFFRIACVVSILRLVSLFCYGACWIVYSSCTSLLSLPCRPVLLSWFVLVVWITLGTYSSLVNKQLNDKERVAAALENINLLSMYLLFLSSYYSCFFGSILFSHWFVWSNLLPRCHQQLHRSHRLITKNNNERR